MKTQDEEINKVAIAIKQAKKIAVLTGAGVSTESGIPDFKSVDNVWTRKTPRKEMMSSAYLQMHPMIFWQTYKELFQLKYMPDIQPNAGHHFLAALEKAGKEVTIITQNVDGLHTKAGSTNVLEVHGSVQHAHCPNCQSVYDLETVLQMEEDEEPTCTNIIKRERVCNQYIMFSQTNKNYGYVTCDNCDTKHTIDPESDSMRCKGIKKTSWNCRHYLKPGVVLFGDLVRHFNEARKAVLEADVFLVMGTSLEVAPINELVIAAQKENKARSSFLLNKEPTTFDDYFDGTIYAPIGETVQLVAEKMRSANH